MSETRTCEVRECAKTTREGKPYCPDHVERHLYVQWILEQISGMDHAAQEIKEHGTRAVDPDGPLVGEILDRLTNEPHLGFASVARLTKEVRRDAAVVRKVLYVASKRGLVILGKNKRGNSTVELIKRGEKKS